LSSRHFFGRPAALILAAAFALTLTGLSYAGDFPANGTHRQTQQRTPDSATGEVEAELRAVVNDYFDVLRDKDWARLDAGALALLEGKQYSHPYYWAGFTLVGVGRRETGAGPPSLEVVGAR
jgi:hypothetical protein